LSFSAAGEGALSCFVDGRKGWLSGFVCYLVLACSARSGRRVATFPVGRGLTSCRDGKEPLHGKHHYALHGWQHPCHGRWQSL